MKDRSLFSSNARPPKRFLVTRREPANNLKGSELVRFQMEVIEECEVATVRPFALASYVPRHIASSALLGEELKPRTEQITAAVLFLDVSGFTKLSETLQTMGSHGVEQLTSHLNLYFGTLINYIDEHGGDVIKIAGDAMIVLWKIQSHPGDENQRNIYYHESMQSAIRKIVDASTKCIRHNQSYKINFHHPKQEMVRKYSNKKIIVQENKSNEGTLQVHCAVACGTLTGIHCGGASDCWEFLVTNPSLFDEIKLALNSARPNEIALAPSANVLVDAKQLFEGEFVKVSKSDAGVSKITVFNSNQEVNTTSGLLDVHKSNEMEDSTWELADTGPSPESNLQNIHFSKFKAWVEGRLIQDVSLKRMLGYSQHVVKSRLLSGHSSCVAELRRCSILFVSLSNFKYEGDYLGLIQKIIAAIQGITLTSEGFIRQFIVDDKGTVIVIAYGVPGMSHEDDCCRCAMASIEIKKRLYDIGVETSMGMTTGRVYCGDVGNRIRREYAIVGDTVNTAAHLMSKNMGILCDHDSYVQSSAIFEFEKLDGVKLKGKTDGFIVYRLLEDKATSQLPKSGQYSTYISRKVSTVEHTELIDSNEDFVLVGRDNETELIEKAMRQFKGGSCEPVTGSGILIHIYGDAGMGKTAVASHINKMAKKLNHHSGFGQLVQGLESLTFNGWVDYITNTSPSLLGSTPESRKQFFTELLDRLKQTSQSHSTDSADSDMDAPRTFLPIFSDVFDFECPENAITQSMTKEQRQNCLRRLLCRHFKSSQTFYTCIIEQAQWMDDASWELVFDVVKSVSNMQIIITYRSEFLDRVRQKTRTRLNKEDCLEISLSALDKNQTEEVVCNILKTRKVPPELSALLFSRSQGVPLLVEETMRYLVRNKYIEVIDSECVITKAQNLADIPFPDNIEGLIVQRLDELDSPTSLLMKVASVIGITFTLNQVSSIYPIKKSVPLIEHMLVLCMKKELIICTSKSSQTYSYKLNVIRQVAYNTLLQRQRRKMHLVLAQSMEKEHTRDLSSKASVIAYHYEMAEKYAKSIYYYGLAATKSHSYSAYDECTKLLQKAFSLATSHGIIIKKLTSVQWGVMMAESLLQERKFDDAESEYKNILLELDIETEDKSKGEARSQTGSFISFLCCFDYRETSQMKKEKELSMENIVGRTLFKRTQFYSLQRNSSNSIEAWVEGEQDGEDIDSGGKENEVNFVGEDDNEETFSIVISTCFYKLARLLLEKRKPDKALELSKRALVYRNDAPYSIEYLLPESLSAIIYLVMGKKEIGTEISKKVLDMLNSSEYKAKEQRSPSHVYSNIALASFMVGSLSSAKYYYSMGLVRLTDTKSSLQHEWISNLCLINLIGGDVLLASKYVKQLVRDLTQRSDLQLIYLLRVMELILYHRSGMGSLESIKAGLDSFLMHSRAQDAPNALERDIVELLLSCLSENIENMEQISIRLSQSGVLTPIIMVAETFCLYTLVKLLMARTTQNPKSSESVQKIRHLFVTCQRQVKQRSRYFIFLEKTLRRMDAYYELYLGNHRHSEEIFSRIVRETQGSKETGFDMISASYELKRAFRHTIDDSIFKIQYNGNISKKNVETFDYGPFFSSNSVLF